MGSFTFPNTARTRWFFWAVVGLTALAAAIRFSTLGLQSYRHDEAVTAGRVLFAGLPRTMHEVWSGESTPPLYYLLAWLWSHLFGVREVGLRSLSAVFGTATVPLAYLAGRELIGRRAGLAVAAIVAVEPMLVWYSQDARAYALLVLLCTAALLFFFRARRTGAARDLAWWAVFSALALSAHYFAALPLAIEAAWLLLAARPLRRVLWAVGGVALAGLALAPIALHQAGGKNNDWIASFGLVGRLRETGIGFFVGEAGLLKHALIPIALYGVGDRAAAASRRGAGEARRGDGADDRRRHRPARRRPRRRRPGLRPRSQPAAGADPAGAARRGGDRRPARRMAGRGSRRRPVRLPARLLRLCRFPPGAAARRLARRRAADRPGARAAGDPRLGAGRRTALLLPRRQPDPGQVEAVAAGAAGGERSRRRQRPAAAPRRTQRAAAELPPRGASRPRSDDAAPLPRRAAAAARLGADRRQLHRLLEQRGSDGP